MQYPTQEYYVAFSIHGTHCFITANILTGDAMISGQKIVIGDFSFTKGQSRDGSSKRNAQKLLSPELRTGSNQPLTNARDIHTYFLKLRENGWVVEDDAFIKTHRLTPIEPPVAKPNTNTDFQAETPPVTETKEQDTVADEIIVETAPTNDTAEQPAPDLTQAVTEETYTLSATPETKSEDKPSFERLDGSIKAIQGDITKFEADGIVNAANAQMIPGGGVDGAINRAAGPELAQAMKNIGGIYTGGAIRTDAFGLQTAKHIIHAVGPIYANYTPEEAADLLRGAYMSAFREARQEKCQTVGVPLLSTGVYGYPVAEACAIAVLAARSFNAGDGGVPLDITFVAFDNAAFAAIQEALGKPSHE